MKVSSPQAGHVHVGRRSRYQALGSWSSVRASCASGSVFQTWRLSIVRQRQQRRAQSNVMLGTLHVNSDRHQPKHL